MPSKKKSVRQSARRQKRKNSRPSTRPAAEPRMKGGRAKTIEEYLAGVSDDKRAALQALRRSIRAAAPRAEECIAYGVPAFRLKGRFLVAFAAAANHCAFYPGSVLRDLPVELRGYQTLKGTIRFQPDHPLPAALVRKLVKARMVRTGAAGGRS